MKTLKTAEQVVDALGGSRTIAAFINATTKTAWRWNASATLFPAVYHAVMIGVLHHLGYDAPPELWGQRALENLAPHRLRQIEQQIALAEAKGQAKRAAEARQARARARQAAKKAGAPP